MADYTAAPLVGSLILFIIAALVGTVGIIHDHLYAESRRDERTPELLSMFTVVFWLVVACTAVGAVAIWWAS